MHPVWWNGFGFILSIIITSATYGRKTLCRKVDSWWKGNMSKLLSSRLTKFNIERGKVWHFHRLTLLRTKECDLLKSINHSNVASVKEWHCATFLQSVHQHFGRSTMSPFGNESFDKESVHHNTRSDDVRRQKIFCDIEWYFFYISHKPKCLLNILSRRSL